MNEIEKFEIIKRSELSEVKYFNSLIGKGYEKNLLNDNEKEMLQIQTLELLKTRVGIYNGLDSSSILFDNAQSIMESNIYTLGVYLKKFKPDEAIYELKKFDLKSMFEEGRTLIKRKIKVAKTLYLKALRTKINTLNETYNETLIGGISGFFKLYNPEFEAHKIKITADYPLFNNLIGKYEGIEFIEKYLQFICYENEFCSNFADKNINYFLDCYSPSYKDLIFNIFEMVITSSIGCSFAGSDLKKLVISYKEIDKADKILKSKSKNEIYEAVLNEYENIRVKLNIGAQSDSYIKNGLYAIQFNIYNAVKNNTLDRVFVIN